MPPENVDVLRRFYAEHLTTEGQRRMAQGSGHIDDTIAQNVVMVNFEEWPVTAPYHGHDGLRAWVRDTLDVVEGGWFEPLELEDAGDGWVAATTHVHGRIGGIESTFVFYPIARVQGGRVDYVKGFLQKEDALAAIEEFKRSGPPEVSSDGSAS